MHLEFTPEVIATQAEGTGASPFAVKNLIFLTHQAHIIRVRFARFEDHRVPIHVHKTQRDGGQLLPKLFRHVVHSHTTIYANAYATRQIEWLELARHGILDPIIAIQENCSAC